MEYHHLPVAAQANIQFNHIYPNPDSFLESGYGIFRRDR
jgi:hypothetical protein